MPFFFYFGERIDISGLFTFYIFLSNMMLVSFKH